MTFELIANDHDGARHVCHHMREWDRREIFATRWSDDPDDVAADILALNDRGGAFWTARWNGVPAGVMGAWCPQPRLWSPWCFGTDAFPHVALGLTRLGKRSIMPAVRYAGGQRMEVKSLDGHLDAQRWLEKCFGFKREGTHARYGKHGETFHTYAVEM